MAKKDLLKGLTDEQLAKARACKSGKELLELASEEGVELTDEQLAAVSGGCGNNFVAPPCPACGSSNTDSTNLDPSCGGVDCVCKDCGLHWNTEKYVPSRL